MGRGLYYYVLPSVEDQSDYPCKRVKLDTDDDIKKKKKNENIVLIEEFPMEVQHLGQLMACHVFDQQFSLSIPAVVTIDSRSVCIRSRPEVALMANNPRYQLDSRKSTCTARWNFQSICFVKQNNDQMVVKLYMHRSKMNVTFDFDYRDGFEKFYNMLLSKVPKLKVFNLKSFAYFLGEEMLSSIRQSFIFLGRPLTQFCYIANGDQEKESIIIEKMIKELRVEFTQNLEVMKRRLKIKSMGYKLILQQYSNYIYQNLR